MAFHACPVPYILYSVVEYKACRRKYEHSVRKGNCMAFPVVKGEETNEKGLEVQQSQADLSLEPAKRWCNTSAII